MKSKTKRILMGIVSLCLFLVVPAWGADVIKIGFSGPLSGGAAKYGKNCEAGMIMATEEIIMAAVKAGGDPRLHVFETVLREQGIDLVG